MTDHGEIHTLAAAVAPFLEGFTVKARPDAEVWPTAELNGPNGEVVYFSPGATWTKAGQGRFEVSGGWPMDNGRSMTPGDVREDRPVITLARDRDPETLARDIARRFLPDYRRIRAALVALQVERAAYRDGRRAQMEAIGEALGLPLPDTMRADDPSLHWSPQSVNGYGEFTPSSVKLNSLTAAQVLAIAKVVAGFVKAY